MARRETALRSTSTRTTIPGPRGYPVVGVLPQFLGNPFDFFVQSVLQYGDVVRLPLGPSPMVLVGHPELTQQVLQDRYKNYPKNYEDWAEVVGSGLVTSNGALWLRQRRLMQPAFHHRKVAALAEVMITEAAHLRERWKGFAASGTPIEISVELMRFTQAVIVRTMFGGAPPAEAERIGQAFRTTLEYTARRLYQIIKLPKQIPTPDNRRYTAAMTFLTETVYRMIEERHRSDEEHDDLLGLLLGAVDPETGESMSPQQIRDEVMTIYFAGHETTANALSWIFLTLSRYPNVLRRVRDEYATVFAGRDPAADDYGRTPYTRQVIDEVLRLYPPAWMATRRALESDTLGEYQIPAGTIVALSPYVLHRLPTCWPNPECFDPDRFQPEQVKARHNYAYLPFFHGPRQCIGTTFALMEIQMVLPMILQHLQLCCVPGHTVRPVFGTTLRPGELWMQVEPVC